MKNFLLSPFLHTTCRQIGRGLGGWGGVLGLIVSLAVHGAAPENGSPAQPYRLMTGFLSDAFQNVNQADAEAAFKVFTRTIGMKRGFAVDTTVRVFGNARDFAEAIRAHTVNLAVVDTWNLLEMKIDDVLDPVFVPSDRGEVAKDFLVLVRRDGPVKALADLRGATLNVLATDHSRIGLEWLEVTLGEAHLGGVSDFFRTAERYPKPSSVVLPVFFGRKQACLVDSVGFGILTELNPQVGRELNAIATSGPLLGAALCLARSGWVSEEFHREIVAALRDLHLDPAGQQILTLFRTGRVLPYEDAQIVTARALRRRAEALKTASPATNPSAGTQ